MPVANQLKIKHESSRVLDPGHLAGAGWPDRPYTYSARLAIAF
ncbi:MULTISPECIES: hypothetical protein [unclassified Microcoleus]|nr:MULTISPECIES: hypothetical protein [unclassified Microcoleus]